MTTFNEREYLLSTAEYGNHFWNVMRGSKHTADNIHGGADPSTGGYALPAEDNGRLAKAIKRESTFRSMATVVDSYKGSRIFAKDSNDLALWVPEGGAIPIYDGVNDFTRYPVDAHKLAVFVKLDEDFIHDAAFNIRDYLTERLAKNFAKAEDVGFVNGTGENMPVGILSKDGGAETAFTAETVTFDDVIRLYFSLDEEYRRKAVWMMNDETALKLRLMKDKDGNHLWNQANETIFGKRVIISNDMPSESTGAMPIVFGDFSYYWIIQRSPVSIRTLTEKFVTLDQIGYLAFEFLDGKLIRREAIKGIRITEKNA